jgi:hypothetical protein
MIGELHASAALQSGISLHPLTISFQEADLVGASEETNSASAGEKLRPVVDLGLL